MARPSKELTEKRKKLMEDYKEIFNVLKHCGGGLYIQDLAIILDRPVNTLKGQLDKCVDVQLVLIDKVVQGTTHKNIVRLSRIAWTNLDENRGKCSAQVDTLDLFFYRAIYQKKFSYINKNNDMIVLDEKDKFKKEISKLIEDDENLNRLVKLWDKKQYYRNQKSIIENLDILNKDNFIVTDCFVTKGMIRLSINCIYRRFHLNNTATFMDLVAGICEMCDFLLREDYFDSKSNIKIDFNIITESKLNKTEVCKDIKKHKRNFHAFTKERYNKPNLYRTFKYAFRNRIGFYYVDKKQGKVIEY